MTEKEKMLAGELYYASDEELTKEFCGSLIIHQKKIEVKY